MSKTFYRVGTHDRSGMWYDQQGNYHGAMNSPAFSMLTCNNVLMPFCPETKGYLSAVETLEDLEKWFSKEDMKVLEPLGYRVLAYSASDYKYHSKNNHWLINEKTSQLIELL